MKLYLVFSHELLQDELYGNGDLFFLGEKQEYNKYLYVKAKNEKEARKKIVDIIYNVEKNDVYFLLHTFSSFFKDIIYEECNLTEKQLKDDYNKIIALEEKMSDAYYNAEQKEHPQNELEIRELINKVYSSFNIPEETKDISENAIRIIWEEYNFRGRIGVLEINELNEDTWE